MQGGFIASSISSPSGILSITGLPFTSANTAEGGSYSAASVRVYGLTGTVNAVQAQIAPNSSTLVIQEFTGTTQADMADHVIANSEFMVSMTYTVAT